MLGCRAQVARDLGPEDLSQEARNEQWHALKAQLAQEQGAAAEAVQAPRPRALLPTHGGACVDLFINSLSAGPALSIAASACRGYQRNISDDLRFVTVGSGLQARVDDHLEFGRESRSVFERHSCCAGYRRRGSVPAGEPLHQDVRPHHRGLPGALHPGSHLLPSTLTTALHHSQSPAFGPSANISLICRHLTSACQRRKSVAGAS